TITQAPAHGTLKHNTDTLSSGATFSGSPQDVSYTPDANYNGNDSFTFKVTDRGDPDNCGTPATFCDAKLDSTETTVPITINSVNDAPDGADKTVATNEDTSYTLQTADFGFTDSSDSPANPLAAVKITTLPGAGTLKNNGVAVTLPAEISATDITAGKLTFSPAADANGNNYAQFDFKVRDDGGIANSGTDLDPVAN